MAEHNGATPTQDTASDPGDPRLIAAIQAEIAAAGGRMTFARFMELALYHPGYGYYLTQERRPGRGGDFLTAPEATPYFGLTLARQIAESWERLGRPRPFTIREYGPGVGGLAYDILVGLSEETPAIMDTIGYRLVEANPHRAAQALAAMAEVGFGEIVTAEPLPQPGEALPPIVGVALANEVADAFPVHRLVARSGRFLERYVTWRGEGFAEEEGAPSSPDLAARWDELAALGVRLQEGDAIEVSPAAAEWLAGVGLGLERGYAIVIDYGYPAAELYSSHRLAGLVRGYAGHTVTDDPFVRVGRQDLTAHVDFTALEAAGRSAGLVTAGFTTQGAFLAGLGLGDVLPRLQQDPSTTPAEYYAAQSAILRLIDPGSLGRFRVLIMAKAAPVDPPLRGFSVPPLTF